MPLIRVKQPFDHPDWLFELKHDGFRALAVIQGHRCTLVSRRGYVFKQWPQLAEELAHTVRSTDAVLDGEVVVLRSDGSSNFNSLLFRREWPHYYAFDLLRLNGDDLRTLPLLQRKKRLRHVIRRDTHSHLRFLSGTSAAAGASCTTPPASSTRKGSSVNGLPVPTTQTGPRHRG
jgi:ATP-dependent DNA ligase